MNKTAFISGHLDLTDDEFRKHYASPILYGIIHGHNFVVGDAKGTDTLAQRFIERCAEEGRSSTDKVTVYHMFDKPRNLEGKFKTIGGFKTDDDRDVAMTKASTYDIAWVRMGREKSGTAKNIKRRTNP